MQLLVVGYCCDCRYQPGIMKLKQVVCLLSKSAVVCNVFQFILRYYF